MPKKRNRKEPSFPVIREHAPVKNWISMTTAALVGGLLAAVLAYEYIQAREGADNENSQAIETSIGPGAPEASLVPSCVGVVCEE